MKENNLEQLLRNGLDYRLETGEYFHFHQSDDNYYDYTLYNKYGEEIDGGMLDFGEDEESQSLMQIRERLADFTGIDELNNPGLEYIPEIDYEDEDYFIEYSEILNEIIKTDTKEEFINEFRKWADMDLLNLIKRNIIKENNGRDYALEDLFPEEEEYKEIEKMFDEDLYDKIEEESYMEKDEINDLWYEQITSLNKKDLIDFCKYYKDFVLKENFNEEER
jgi:hypothetical protein